jgi:Pyridoxamine 5'-phosphate oxidase
MPSCTIPRRRFLGIALAASATLPWARAARAEAPAATGKALEDASLIYVATRRKSGERSTAAPIWFYYENGEIFFTTSPDSWKAKRIGRGSPLFIWVGSEDGPFLLGEAERVTDPGVVAHMGEEYAKKYWIAWLGLFRPRPDRVAEGKTVAYRVQLTEGTPPPPPAR